MSKNISSSSEQNIFAPSKALEITFFINQLKNGVWLFGIPSWLFGITDRSIAAFADGYLSSAEIIQIFTASFFFLSWIYLKPQESWESYTEDSSLSPEVDSGIFYSTICRSDRLKNRHMISQEYILPIPYLCQIYHLLNLKHLESVHKFSLNNLKVVSVIDAQATPIGGKIKFQTVLDSPINPLRIWRQPIVEVDLILHNPYTVELSIPVYNNKKICVIFTALPLINNEHQFFIDIYSDLEWPKPIMQILLHFAACLTLFEDLPYMQALAAKSTERLLKVSKNLKSENDTMWLYNRFVELYGSYVETHKLIGN